MTASNPRDAVQPEAIVFDLGGVLLQLRPEDSFAAFAKLGATRFSQAWHEDTPQQSLARFETGASDTATFRQEINAFCGTTLDDARFDDAFNAMLGPISEETMALLASLAQKARIYLLSNNNDIHLTAIERRYPNLRAQFVGAYFSQEIGHKKPDLNSFAYVVEAAQLEGVTTCFIDDSQANVVACEQAGWRGLHLLRNAPLSDFLRQKIPNLFT